MVNGKYIHWNIYWNNIQYIYWNNGCIPIHWNTAIKNKIMLFAATWMQVEIIILSEVRERQIPYDITYMWNLKDDTNKLICETERESQT